MSDVVLSKNLKTMAGKHLEMIIVNGDRKLPKVWKNVGIIGITTALMEEHLITVKFKKR